MSYSKLLSSQPGCVAFTILNYGTMKIKFGLAFQAPNYSLEEGRPRTFTLYEFSSFFKFQLFAQSQGPLPVRTAKTTDYT